MVNKIIVSDFIAIRSKERRVNARNFLSSVPKAPQANLNLLMKKTAILILLIKKLSKHNFAK